ncbi:immunoglobulin-like domain-containing protein, partial [Planctomycetota bacterium]
WTWAGGSETGVNPTVTLPLGTTTVTLIVNDGEFSDTDTVDITIGDTTPPVITLNGPAMITLECGIDEYEEYGATAWDTYDPAVSVEIGGDIVDTSTCGTYVVTYNATDASGIPAVQVERTVIVEDTAPPVISLNGNATITFECGIEEYEELGATALDTCDPAVSVEIGGDTVDVSTCGIYTVTYDATDTHGNAATQVIRTVNVVDTTPPEVTLSEPDPSVLWPANHQFVEVLVSGIAGDTCDDTLAIDVSVDVIDAEGGDGSSTDEGDFEVLAVGIEGNEIIILVALRAERSGQGDGRIYQITVDVRDGSGNTTTNVVEVSVAHDQGEGKGKKK